MALTAALSLLTLLVAAQEPEYFEIGKSKKFDPKYSGSIRSITWKHKGNIVAEYIQDVVPLEYLGDLTGRANVDLTTGVLTVSNMRKSDDGVFTVEINNRVLPVSFTAVGIENLDYHTVEVIVRPLTCNDDKCSLECGADFDGAEPVQYFWKKGEAGQWEQGDKKITISQEPWSCKVKNPISENVSDQTVNPFKRNPPSSSDF